MPLVIPKLFGESLTALNIPITPIDLTIPEPKKETAAADASTLAKGKAILARLQQAAGGAEMLASVKDFVRKTDVNIETPQGTMAVKQTNQWLAPSYFRQDQELPFGMMTAYYDGKTGWLAAQGKVQPMPPPIVKQIRGGLLRNPFLLWLADRQEGWKVNAVNDIVLEISDDAGEVVRLEVDPVSGLPVKLTYDSAQAQGPPARLEETFSDWRDVQGIRLPFQVTTTRDGAPYGELAVTQMDLNTGLTVRAMSAKP